MGKLAKLWEEPRVGMAGGYESQVKGMAEVIREEVQDWNSNRACRSVSRNISVSCWDPRSERAGCCGSGWNSIRRYLMPSLKTRTSAVLWATTEA